MNPQPVSLAELVETFRDELESVTGVIGVRAVAKRLSALLDQHAVAEPQLTERIQALETGLRDLLQYLDEHDWGHVPEGATADRARALLLPPEEENEDAARARRAEEYKALENTLRKDPKYAK